MPDTDIATTTSSNICQRYGKRLWFFDHSQYGIFGPGRRAPKATLVVVLVVISSLKIPKAFLIHSGEQQNFAQTFMLTFSTYFLMNEQLAS